jgi:hypothetical protein
MVTRSNFCGDIRDAMRDVELLPGGRAKTPLGAEVDEVWARGPTDGDLAEVPVGAWEGSDLRRVMLEHRSVLLFWKKADPDL